MMKEKVKPVSAEEIAELFKRRQLTNTSERITFSINNRIATEQDLFDKGYIRSTISLN